MVEPPEFLTYPVFSNNQETFRPIPPNRRGELVAWLSALTVTLSIVILHLLRGSVPCYAFGILVFLFTASLLISYGNWMESRTSIQVSETGIRFASPVRRLSFSWPDIDCLAALKTRVGWRVMVEGEQGSFTFRTGGKIAIGSLEAPLTGYPDGERLASLIRGMAGLAAPIQEEGIWFSRRETK